MGTDRGTSPKLQFGVARPGHCRTGCAGEERKCFEDQDWDDDANLLALSGALALFASRP